MNLKKLLLTLTAGALTLAACAPAQPAASVPASTTGGMTAATSTPAAAAYLSIAYADAASLRNQLAYGTLKLEGSPQAVSPAQAKTLLPLWQAVIALSGTDTTATEELAAVQDQITAALTPAQLQAIAVLQITNAALTAFYAEHGVVLPTPVPGVTKVPGSGSGLAQADKEATRTAAAAAGLTTGTGAGQAAKTLLFNTVVELLTARSAQ